MNFIENKILTGIVENNSCDYISKVFHELNNGQSFSSISQGKNIEKLNLEYSNIVETLNGGGWYSGNKYKISNDSRLAQMAFSSGTEGKIKCIKISHSALADTTNRLISIMEMNSEIREYVGIPVYHSFGFGRCRAISTVDGNFYIPPNGFSIIELVGLLKENQVNAISAVPSLWRMLIPQSNLFIHEGKKVRWIEIGSQYMSAEEKSSLKGIFPNAVIVQHYGLTEASRSTFLAIHKTEGRALESVGKPIVRNSVKINKDGLICIKGPHVSESMVTEHGEVLLKNSTGWLTTNDIGHFEKGYLFFDGRNDDQINCGGIKVFPEMIESKVKRMSNIFDGWAIVGVPNSIRGEIPLLVLDSLTISKEKELLERIFMALEELNLNIKDSLDSYCVDTIPLTNNGKIKRKEIVNNYKQQKLHEDAIPENSIAGFVTHYLKLILKPFGIGAPKNVKGVFKSNFPNQKIKPEDTFVDLGGDSLSYLSTAIDLERVLPELPVDWHKLPVCDLEKLNSSRSNIFTRIDSSIFLRALSIVLVVMGHLNFFEYGGGGAYALFFIAGVNFARFTIPKTISDDSSLPVLILVFRVMILTFFFFAINFILTGYGELPAAMFYSNWVGSDIEGGAWFVEVYIQMLFFLSIVLFFRQCRTQVKNNAFLSSIIFTAMMLSVSIICNAFINTSHLYGRLPHLLTWIFLCGVSLNYATSIMQRIIVTLIFLFGWALIFNGSSYYFLSASLILIWIVSLPIPRLISSMVKEVANASLIIYLTHFQFASIYEKLFGENIGGQVLLSLVGGVVLWKLYIFLDVIFCDRLYAKVKSINN